MAELEKAYRERGYLPTLPVLSEEELEEARRGFSDLEGEFGEEYTQYSLHNVHVTYPWVMALVKHPRVLHVVKAVLGPDVIMLDSRFICKYPTKKEQSGLGGEADGLPYVAWHQDIRYWGIEKGHVLSIWIALDDSVKENGALKVIPGSHRSGLLLHRRSTRPGNMLSVNQEIPEELLETDRAVWCELAAGQMSVHDGFLVHSSDTNRSRRRRCGLVVRYVPTSARPIEDPDRPRKFPATVLVSGEDRFNHFSQQ